jgi:hypothetical protein
MNGSGDRPTVAKKITCLLDALAMVSKLSMVWTILREIFINPPVYVFERFAQEPFAIAIVL